jgi:hypothetical protein
LLWAILPFIEVSAKDDGQRKEIPVYIYTNGVHTDIVMPVRTIYRTGAPKFRSANTKSKSTDYNYVEWDGEIKGSISILRPGRILSFQRLLKLLSGSANLQCTALLQDHERRGRL